MFSLKQQQEQGLLPEDSDFNAPGRELLYVLGYLNITTMAKNLGALSTPMYIIDPNMGQAKAQGKLAIPVYITDTDTSSVIIQTFTSGITAAGANQATATIVSKTRNRIDTVAAGTGVVPDRTAVSGFFQTIQNNGANDLLYYPFSGDHFYVIGSGAMAADAPVTIASGNEVTVLAYNDGELTII